MSFLSPVSHSSKLIELVEGVMGTSDLQPGCQKHQKNLDLGLASEVGSDAVSG